MKHFSLPRFAIALVIALVSAGVVAIQNPQQPPTPGPEVKKLDYFAGAWKSDGEVKPGPMGAGGKFSGTEHNEWTLGGFFLISHSTEASPMGSGSGIGMYGYDPEKKVYTFDEFNSAGQTVHAKGTLAGDTWTWTSDEMMQGTMTHGRYTVKVTSPTAYTFKLEFQPEGGTWAEAFAGKATKTK